MGSNIRVPRWLDITGRVVSLRPRRADRGHAARRRCPSPRRSTSGRCRTCGSPTSRPSRHDDRAGLPARRSCSPALLSMLFGPVWCRYLCPVGGMYCAVADAVAVLGRPRRRDLHPLRHAARRSATRSARPRRSRTVRDTECDGCMDCVKVCPVDGLPRGQGRRPGAHRAVGLAAARGRAVARDLRRRQGHRQLGLADAARAVQGGRSTPGFSSSRACRSSRAAAGAACSLRRHHSKSRAMMCTTLCTSCRSTSSQLCARGDLSMLDATWCATGSTLDSPSSCSAARR